jgi:hypothetical protein
MAVKNKISILLCNLVILSLICGYSQPYYAPNMHNVPLFQEKNDARLGAAISIAKPYLIGGEIQVTYAITNNIGVMVNGISGKDIFPDVLGGTGLLWDKQLKLIEFGSGYSKSLNNKFVFETYGGLGFGKLFYKQTYSLNFIRYFIQPAIGYTTKDIDLAFSTRFIRLNSTNIQYEDNIWSYYRENLDYIINNNFLIFIEPAITFRYDPNVTYKRLSFIEFQVQIGLSQNLNNTEFKQKNFNFSIGLYCGLKTKNLKINS